MKNILILIFLGFFSTVDAQHILKREYGVIYNPNGAVLISPPNLTDGFGSSDNGLHGDSISFYYEEQNDSYNGVDLVGSSWMSYGDLLPLWLPGIVSVGVGFTPDTFNWEFTSDSIFANVKDAETSGIVYYRFEYQQISGSGNGIDSLHLYDSLVTEPSIIKVFDNLAAVSIREKFSSLELEVFPNPSSGQILIKLPDGEIMNNIKIQDISGKTHLSLHNIHSANINLDINNLTNAVYLVNIETESGALYYKKIVVK